MTATRPLVRVPVPPGPDGVQRLLPPLAAALDGSGPAIAPVPTVSASMSNDYVMSLLAAVRPDDAGLPLESDEVAAVLATSGSTGAPRGVLLTAAQLTAMSPHANGPGRPQWVVALPVTSMGGFNVLVRALAADRDPVVVASVGGAEPFTAALFHDAMERAAARADDVRASLVPAQLARLLAEDAGVEALRRCTQVLVGGAATRPAHIRDARALGIAITTTYGATETAGGCVYDGRPLPGVTVTAEGSPGRLTIAGPCVALGYRGEPELTAQAFTAEGYRTPDLGEVHPDGTVQVIGRADDVVIVRGVNVSPAAVERVIADLPDVAAAAVVVVTDGRDEPEVHAFLEVRDGAPVPADDAVAAVVQQLGPAARPQVRTVARLPHLPNGKVDRIRLAAWAGAPDDEGTH